MGVAIGLVAFALTGVGIAPHAERDQGQVTYTVRMVEADGVGWREAVYTDLKPVTRQGSATVWTVPQNATTRLIENLGKSHATKVLQAPKITALNGTPATVQCRQNRPVVTQVAWTGDESAPKSMPENVRVGWHTTMIGRKLDQGILVQVVFEDTVIRAVHQVKVNRSSTLACLAKAAAGQTCTATGIAAQLAATAAAIQGKDAVFEKMCTESKACCAPEESGVDDCDVQKVVLEVPEIDTQEVVGEWLIPHGEALLVSFGAHTVADTAGKAVVKERLAIIEAVETPGAPRVAIVTGLAPVITGMDNATVHTDVMVNSPNVFVYRNANVPRVSVPAPKVGMPTPAMPSRSIPQGVHADGTPADLPPLPADETEPDSSASESSEPLPSPQTKKPPKPKPTTDSGANKAEFSLPKVATAFLPNLFLPNSATGFQFLLPMKPMSIKLPFGQKLEVEIFGKIVPESEGH